MPSHPWLRYAREGMLEGYVQTDRDGRIQEWNGAWEAMLGYEPAELLSFTLKDLTPEPWKSREAEIIARQVLRQGYSDIYEKEFLRHDGTTVPVEVRAVLIGPLPDTPGCVGFFVRDLTPKKRAEERVRKTEEKFTKAFHLSPDAVNINRLRDGVYLAINEGFTKTTGYTAEEVIGKSSLPGDLGIWVHREDRDRLVAALQAHGEISGLEAQFRMKDGTVKTGLMSAKVIVVEDEPCILSVTRDITERKRAEEALRLSEGRMRVIIEGTPQLFFYTQDGDANTTYVSPTVEAITGYTPEEWVKQRDWFITDAEINRGAKESTRARLRGEPVDVHIVLEIRHKAGHRILLEVYEYPLVEHGRIVGLHGVAHDITKRKLAEDAIVRSLREKEVLLKEIHHRVKNNLQVISSMLNLQAVEVGDTPIRAALREAQSRVLSMALIHERLYGVSDFSRVDLFDYAKGLAAHLSHTWHRPGIKISVNGRETFVGVDTAIPCGLILNELVTNALKHAFRGREEGIVRVTVDRGQEGEVEVGVHDNGVGFPTGAEFAGMKSLGATLVMSLVDQLGGTIGFERDGGTRCVVRFRA